MKKNSKPINDTKINNISLFVIFMATLFMAVGYASINNVTLDLIASAGYAADKTVHITNVTTEHGDSTINNISGTMLNSIVDLTNHSTETFTITVFNNTNETYYFNDVLRDTEQSLFYDNQNITFTLNGISKYDVLSAGQSKTFTITFGYVNGFTPTLASDKVLHSYINFKFSKGYSVTYNNITTQQSYPSLALRNEAFVVSFGSDVPYDVKVTMDNTVLTEGTDYTYTTDPNNASNKLLTVNNVTNTITIDRYYQIIYNLDGGTNNANNPTKYLHGVSETILDATKTNSIFDGWYENSSFTGNKVTSTSGKSGTLTLYAKWSTNSYVTATTYLLSLVGNAEDTSTNIITLNTPSGATCTNTLAYDGTSDKNLRYVGADPCNYVKFNCDSNGNNCESWRIIGVMKAVDSSPVLKIVKSAASTSSWHSKNSNSWNNANINTSVLNNTLLNSFNAGVINDYALSVQWRIGAVAFNNTVSTAYTAEKGTSSTAAYIGLINVSDYYYATSGTSDSTRTTCLNSALNGSGISSTCYNNDYLFVTNNNTGQNQWTINKSNQGNSVIYVSNSGKAVRGTATSSYYYRPVIYLKSTVKINTQSGNGSINSPYELHVDS